MYIYLIAAKANYGSSLLDLAEFRIAKKPVNQLNQDILYKNCLPLIQERNTGVFLFWISH